MPLAFESINHGTLAFGFFNIEIDMLLLDRLFFFADRFCRAVVELAETDRASIAGWRIDDAARRGDLHGAIAGEVLSGFIGATYRKFPFPEEKQAFRQNPDGWRNQQWAADQLAAFGEPVDIELSWDGAERRVHIGDYLFDRCHFVKLITYVDRGGWPRWKQLIRPPYVQQMMKQLAECKSKLWYPG